MALIVIRTVLVSAQVNSTGTISGRVVDSKGDVLSGAAVLIVEQLTNVETKVTTNNSGFYSAGFLKLTPAPAASTTSSATLLTGRICHRER